MRPATRCSATTDRLDRAPDQPGLIFQFGEGAVFETATTGNSYGAPTTLVTFNGNSGSPDARLIAEAAARTDQTCRGCER
jgi:hypothetical protein